MPRSSKGPWFKKGRGWHVQHDGHRYFLSHDKEEAQKKWHRIQSGEPPEDATEGTVLFWHAAEAYLDELERTRSVKHHRGTRWRLNQLSEHWSKRSLASLRLTDIETVMRKHAWNTTTQASVLTALRGLLRWASRPGGMIPVNPLPQITLPRANRRVHILTTDQIQSLLESSGPELRLILFALAQSGARPSELIRARGADCDDDGSAIRLPTGKQGRRIIFFPPAARETLATLKAKSKGPLFTQPNGDAWSEFWFFTLARKARKAAGLPTWATAYTLRHTFATNLLRKGVPIATAARLLGTSATLLDSTYGHLSDQDLRAVADEMG